MTTTREQVEHTADRVREELLVTLEELERRGKLAVNVPYQVSTHLLWVVGASVGVLVLATVGLVTARVRRRSRRTLRLRARLRGLMRAWEHPERVATPAKAHRLPVDMLRKGVLALTAAFSAQLGRSGAKRLLAPGPTPH